MRLSWLVLLCSTAAFSQSFEASVSGGKSLFPAKSATIGTDSTGGAYKMKEGFRVRPFAAGGVQFTAFSQPGDYGNRETKYGINYGGGLKIKVKSNWGMRLDARQYNMGKPFKLANNSGRLLMWEFSGGVAFLM